MDDLEENVFWILVFINFNKNWREVFKDGVPKAIYLVNYLE